MGTFLVAVVDWKIREVVKMEARVTEKENLGEMNRFRGKLFTVG